ncbi:MAG: nitroreductase family deazaflavin-dependent oxidoreductase [Anaerolineales bacterium]|nr:nitroreductase family deazaflavin-dependent oxidoreductase [Anaerolineales bacterium]
MTSTSHGDLPPTLHYKPWPWQRALHALPASTLGSRFFSKWVHQLDRTTLQLSGGRLTFPGLVTGLPIITLPSIGAKSGQTRTTPVVGVAGYKNVILIARQTGDGPKPGMGANLRANPRVTLTFQNYSGPYDACEVTDAHEYAVCWNKAVDTYAGYASYRKRAGDRAIPSIC